MLCRSHVTRVTSVAFGKFSRFFEDPRSFRVIRSSGCSCCIEDVLECYNFVGLGGTSDSSEHREIK